MIKKIFKVTSYIFLVVILAFVAFVAVTGKTYVYKALLYNFADVDDYKIFSNRTIPKSTKPYIIPQSSNYNQTPLTPPLTKTLDSLQTFAFLVVKNDSVVYEEYKDGYNEKSYSNSFSVAKSVVSILIGVALKEGKIKSIDEPVGNYLAAFNSDGKEKISIRHLLNMSSGLNWDEAYSSPFSMTTEAYYGTDLPKLISKLEAIEEPGKVYRYMSGNTQLLGLILEKATGQKLANYASGTLWQPLGMENDALWSLDKENGTEKAYCCINSNARDFAKLGLLYLHYGQWKGEQIVDSSYVKESVQPAPLLDPINNINIDYYGLQWWLMPKTEGIFYARGILGQYIFVIPAKKLVVVRLGKKRGQTVDGILQDAALYVNEVQKIFG